MRIRSVALGLLGLTLTACSSNHTEEVDALARSLDEVPGFEVERDYEPGDMMFAGTATFSVTADDRASDADVRRFLVTAFERIDDDLGGEGADVGVEHSSGEYRLHVQDTVAEPEELEAVLAYAQESRREGETLAVELEALEENEEDLASAIEIVLPHGTGRDDVLPRVAELDHAPPHTDVLVRAADGSALSGFDDIPSAADRELWTTLSTGPFAASYSVDYAPLNLPGRSRSARVVLTLHREPRDNPARDLRRAAFMRAHLAALEEAGVPRFFYYVNKGDGAVLQLDGTTCDGEWKSWQGWRREVARSYVSSCA